MRKPGHVRRPTRAESRRRLERRKEEILRRLRALRLDSGAFVGP